MVVTMEDLRAGRVDFADLVEPGAEDLPPIHPGEHVRDWLEQVGVTAYALAKAMRVPQTRLAEIVAGRRGITADTALRLARWFGTSAELWMNLQQTYELDLARQPPGLHRWENGRAP